MGGATFEYFDRSSPTKGHCDPNVGYCSKPMFENELSKAGYWGYGYGNQGSKPMQDLIANGEFEIVDTIKVPDDIKEGDYVSHGVGIVKIPHKSGLHVLL